MSFKEHIFKVVEKIINEEELLLEGKKDWIKMIIGKKGWRNAEHLRPLFNPDGTPANMETIEEMLDSIIWADPTPRKNYVPWLIKIAKDDPKLFEDMGAVKQTLEYWEENKNTNGDFMRAWSQSDIGSKIGFDIQKLNNYKTLQSFIQNFIRSTSEGKADDINMSQLMDSEIIWDSDQIQEYNEKHGTNYFDNRAFRFVLIKANRPEDVCLLSQGTSWCVSWVSNASQANRIGTSENPWQGELKKVKGTSPSGKEEVGYPTWASNYMTKDGKKVPMYIIYKQNRFEKSDGEIVPARDQSFKPYILFRHDGKEFFNFSNVAATKISPTLDNVLGLILLMTDLPEVTAKALQAERRKSGLGESYKTGKREYPRPLPT